MRLKIATVLLLAGTVVGCASNPPPPPPMAAAPEPMPAAAPPAPMPPMAGMYRGSGTAEGGKSCRASKMQSARVRGNTIMVGGMRGMIGPDGMVTGRNLSGSVMGNMADVTVKRGKCTYEYKMTNGKAMAPMSSDTMPSSSMPSDGTPSSTGM